MRALAEIETVQFGTELVEGDEVTPPDFGATFVHGAHLPRGGLHARQEVEANGLANELAAGAALCLLCLLEVPDHVRGE